MAVLPTDKLRIDGKLYAAPCWPPPEKVEVAGRTYTLAKWSQLTDEEASILDFVFRGAEYELVEPVQP
jgi:hypothetical protein